MRIETSELDALQQHLVTQNYKHAHPAIEKTPWGTRDMSVIDPFSNRLTFTSPISC